MSLPCAITTNPALQRANCWRRHQCPRCCHAAVITPTQMTALSISILHHPKCRTFRVLVRADEQDGCELGMNARQHLVYYTVRFCIRLCISIRSNSFRHPAPKVTKSSTRTARISDTGLRQRYVSECDTPRPLLPSSTRAQSLGANSRMTLLRAVSPVPSTTNHREQSYTHPTQ